MTTGNFYYQDSLGNTSHVTDAAGNLLERYTYSAFGTPTFFSANNTQLSTSAYGIRHLFQGQLWTQETGLNDYRNRVELPAMGVFLQPDPIGFKGDAANIYRFCGNDPVDRTDPMGLVWVDTTWSRLMWMQGNSLASFNQLLQVYQLFQPAGMDGGQRSGGGGGGQRSIADVAADKIGSNEYLTDKASGNYAAGQNKCNKLVADVIEESGRPRPQVHYSKTGGLKGWLRTFGTRDPTAHDWATKNIPHWSGPRPLSEARRNDIIAQAHGKFGHVGVIDGLLAETISVNTKIGGIPERNSWGFRSFPDNGEQGGDPAPVVRHYTGD